MVSKGRILVADDEASLRLLLRRELARAGYTVDVVSDGDEALDKIREQLYHVVLLDIVMPKRDGMSVLGEMRKDEIPTRAIILTGNASIESAVECMRLGAFEYVRKPYSLDEMLILIERAIEHHRTRIDAQILRDELDKSGHGGRIIGRSKAIRDLKRVISRIAPTQSTVLILGESGSGKELVARAIHDRSPSREEPFVAVNCPSLSETLLESELFGHEKGAFTDAKTQKRGLAETADGGTLFLDEISEIPRRFQAKLLRFLETGEIRRVGGTKDIQLNVRILCATNRALDTLVLENEFRRDLYYRLNVLNVTVPPLREHPEDIPLLVAQVVRRQGFDRKFDRKSLGVLASYDWPGNVRELKNVVERACVLTSALVVTDTDLSFLRRGVLRDAASIEQLSVQEEESGILSLKEVEREHILKVLRYVEGHKGKAAKYLKINPKTLYHKMKSYNIVTDFR